MLFVQVKMDGVKVNEDNENSFINEKIEEFISWNKVCIIIILCN